MRLAETCPFDLAVIDRRLPGLDGEAVFRRLRSSQQDLRGILITGFPEYPDGVVRALRDGFTDYIEKPIGVDKLTAAVNNALRLDAHTQVDAASRHARSASELPAMVAACPVMREVVQTATRVAATDEPVLISGETGTGKELVARAIHEYSKRHAAAFTALNCGALGPDSLLESELFGYERGAFTGAATRTQGWFEAAHGGTLFLDEVSELSAQGQAKLLRVIERGEVTRLGSRRTVTADVRIVAATNVDLAAAPDRAFRKDLLYRLNPFEIRLPPLRNRTGELPYLLAYLLPRVSAALRIRVPEVSEAAFELLAGYAWPGNVRELQNELKRACLRCDGPVLDVSHLSPQLRATKRAAEPSASYSLQDRVHQELTTLEAELIRTALADCRGNVSAAARLLKVSRRTLQRRLSSRQV